MQFITYTPLLHTCLRQLCVMVCSLQSSVFIITCFINLLLYGSQLLPWTTTTHMHIYAPSVYLPSVETICTCTHAMYMLYTCVHFNIRPSKGIVVSQCVKVYSWPAIYIKWQVVLFKWMRRFQIPSCLVYLISSHQNFCIPLTIGFCKSLVINKICICNV